ncbi:aminotransferase class IV [Ideonella sp. 4Y11]|uniref:branched-chain-amino-acid transaminase n=1 Tax=Ideonella aquatica TaxID=2824119 RepID=A0A941BHU3_9BURK|nr:aminotransferase class IV [Ideonella aquatica]MBQ0957972.1 aminotransferase class IV [Ideonella aquatica]
MSVLVETRPQAVPPHGLPLDEEVWLNDQIMARATALISVSDRGLNLADGVFETLLVQDGRPLWLGDHLARLRQGAQRLRLPLPWCDDAIGRGLAALLSRAEVGHRCVARITLTRGPAATRGLWHPCEPVRPTLLMGLSPWSANPVQHVVLARQTCRNERSPLSGIKSLAYGDQLLARQEALDRGATDALLCDTRGRLACATVGNVFLHIDGSWYTPWLNSGVLPGLARRRLIARLQARDTALPSARLVDADSAFICNSLGCAPIASIDQRELQPPPRWDHIAGIYHED